MKRNRQQRKLSHHPHAARRGGFTLIELMVVVAIIATLVGIIVPAVSSARASARNAQCLNNIRNVGLAINNLATSNNGKYPYLEDGGVGWPVRILERFDQAALAREIRTSGMPSPIPVIEGFTCPDDLDSRGQAGGLSYAANMGYAPNTIWGSTGDTAHQLNALSWRAGSTDKVKVALATGVFFRRLTTGNARSTMSAVSGGDGTAQTILLAENLQCGTWNSTGSGEIGFALSINVVGGAIPTAIGLNTNESGLSLKPSFTVLSSMINDNIGAATAQAWRPSANHSGSVNVVFCDGHARSINENMDETVYARILTSSGVQHGQEAVSDLD